MLRKIHNVLAIIVWYRTCNSHTYKTYEMREIIKLNINTKLEKKVLGIKIWSKDKSEMKIKSIKEISFFTETHIFRVQCLSVNLIVLRCSFYF